MTYEVPEELLQKVFNYLISKPFVEVAALIPDLQKCVPNKPPIPVVD